MFQIFDPREEMAKLVASAIIFCSLKLLLENLVGYLWWISVNVLSNTHGLIYRSSHWRCSVKKMFLEILQNSQENICARVSFLIKLQACNFIKKQALVQVFPVNFAKFLRTPFLQNTSWRVLLKLCLSVVPTWGLMR